MRLEWSEAYSINNTDLDEQHKRWIELYNRLADLMKGENQADLGRAKAETLREMADYVDYHFRFEEEYMRSIEFPEVKNHWRLHKNFRNRIYQTYRDQQKGDIVLNTEILATIRTWLKDHILREDAKIVDFLQPSAAGRE